jgi:hypothetical protein
VPEDQEILAQGIHGQMLDADSMDMGHSHEDFLMSGIQSTGPGTSAEDANADLLDGTLWEESVRDFYSLPIDVGPARAEDATMMAACSHAQSREHCLLTKNAPTASLGELWEEAVRKFYDAPADVPESMEANTVYGSFSNGNALCGGFSFDV